MLRYLAGRFAQALVVLWAAYTVAFVILHVLPSDPVTLQLSASGADIGTLTPAQLHLLEARYGLDDSILVQYFRALGGALHGDFGMSLTQNVSVSSLIADKLPDTLLLSAVAIPITLLFGVGIAFLAIYVQWRPARVLLARLPAVGVSLPQFFVGLLLIQVFAFSLSWLPATGNSGADSLVLPAVTMALPGGAMLAQLLTRSLADTWGEPYILTARAKGLSRWATQLRHALRNASLPALTLLGVIVGYTVTNAVVVEAVFSRNGIGQLAQQAVLGQDVPVVQAIVLIGAVLFVSVNLLVDLLYSLLDPRVASAARVA
ncbi:ABC-type dipeptide/oligopeptide/nickel transport system, permease component [Frankia canadensis]|uniref:ABC-type dipeptide/oligopeptide/nickel transport system, permease component n=1 Tax=Frankia canadensis TaxID=1836972 RepID=A0A2I2L1Z2_9ACTN|nr:ABC transporter permease [Frankia canadensis]SNQ51943.1 ABC-type dipeptide/oligopeptide/nickel transport system, permease component [Frankia canadensis]SOU59233.1 ABC-type dipeptide/oligopeptide/nickel transport system, permease component [Frankia canadensis]